MAALITRDSRVKTLRYNLMTAIETLTGITGYVAPESKTAFPSDGDFFIVQVTDQKAQATNRTTNKVVTVGNVTSFERHDYWLGECTAQIDVYGANSQDHCNTIALLSRSDLLTQYGLTPLYGTDPKQLPFTNAGDTLTERWMIELKLQFNTDALTVAPQLITANLTTTGL